MKQCNFFATRQTRTIVTALVLLCGMIASGAVAFSTPSCILFSYDGTGNRTSVTTGTLSAPTWNSGTWGCFAWTP